MTLTRSHACPDYLGSTRKFTLFSMVLLAATFHFITTRGIDYVSHPKLNAIDDVLNYNGKGFESGRNGRPVKMSNPVSLEKEAQKREVRKMSSVLPSLMSSNQATAKQD